jgi:hypothetical protein
VTSSWHQPVTLTGRTLILTPLRLADAPDFLAALGPPHVASEVLQHMSYGPPADVAATRAVIVAALADTDRLAYSQRLAATGELVGTTSFYEINPMARSLAIGHTWLAKAHWRTGVNTESKLMCSLGPSTSWAPSGSSGTPTSAMCAPRKPSSGSAPAGRACSGTIGSGATAAGATRCSTR